MGPQRRPRRRGRDGRTRRQVLVGVLTAGVGAGVGGLLYDANAFTSGTVPRNSTVQVAADQDAIVGLSMADSVQRKTRTLLAELTNNGTDPYTLTVALDDPTQGTLYGPNGSGDTVTLTLDPGTTGSVDIETDEKKGTAIPFTISRDAPEFSFSIDRETTAQAGNVEGPVTIEKLKRFKADDKENRWTIKTLTVSSDQYDLDTIDLVIEEAATGTTVAARTYENVGSQTFVRDGTGNDPGIVLAPDDAGYDVRKKTTYRLTVTAYDTHSNFDRETRTT